jgi:DNA-binding XRE family transcriptional regulator
MGTKRRKKKQGPPTPDGSVDAVEFFENLYGPLTFGDMLWSIRMCDELSQTEFAEMLGVSRSHICDVEKGRKLVSPARALPLLEVNPSEHEPSTKDELEQLAH